MEHIRAKSSIVTATFSVRTSVESDSFLISAGLKFKLVLCQMNLPKYQMKEKERLSRFHFLG